MESTLGLKLGVNDVTWGGEARIGQTLSSAQEWGVGQGLAVFLSLLGP